MPPKINLTGQRFGKLICKKDIGRMSGRVVWLCLCDCGKESKVVSSNLLRGHISSCGCSRNDNPAGTTHGLSMNADKRKTRLYSVWIQMRQRCLNSKNKSYHRYGGRGISVCKEWDDYAAFHLWAMANGYHNDLTIERINNNGNYEPDNCKWATHKEQGQNSSRNRLITFCGNTRTLGQWADLIGMHHDALRERLDNGWSVEKALTTPVNPNLQRHRIQRKEVPAHV